MYKENEIFDFYFNIFILEKNERVLAETPLDSIKSHRFGYIKLDINNKSPRTLIILPYLHDHKIYLNRLKVNTDYFYTSVETNPTDEDAYHNDVQQKIKRRSTTIARDFGKSVSKSNDTRSETFTSIIAMNETESKYYVYTQNGLLINRIDFSDLVENYGNPISTSSNGLNFIFKKNLYDY